MRVFAGPNGSGKTTLFEKFRKHYDPGVPVNADDIQKQLMESGFLDLSGYHLSATAADLANFSASPDGHSLLEMSKTATGPASAFDLRENCMVIPTKYTLSYHAAFSAAFIRWLLIRKGASFSMETVMSHPSKIREIESANGSGYRTYLYFVCTEDASINVERVGTRVSKGGHFVDAERIRNRYSATLSNLPDAIAITYRSYIFDNSGVSMRMIAEAYMGRMTILDSNLPAWFLRVIHERMR